MESPTCLDDTSIPLVLDTSAVINICATGFMSELLRAVQNPLLCTNVVQQEIRTGHQKGRTDFAALQSLIAQNLVRIVEIDDSTEDAFSSLVIGPATETLDDGEAATIAYAYSHNCVAIIDERKAVRIGLSRFPRIRLASTVDLFSHPGVLASLSKDQLSAAVLNALQVARMNVRAHHLPWVLNMIGRERASDCPSLPRSVR